MARFLFIHGSCHGAWCWRDVLSALKILGHRACAIDLPSHGADATPIRNVTLDLYRDVILAASTQDTILVGHSMAGFPMAAAAEKAPRKMARLVFLCAYAPQNGLSLVDMRKLAPRQPLLSALLTATNGQSYTIDPAQLEKVFYHDCPPGTLKYVGPRLCPQAILPQATPISLTKSYDKVAKSYIRCTNDQTIPPEYQSTMTKDWPRKDIHDMPTGHSPFFADPTGLANLLDNIAKDAA